MISVFNVTKEKLLVLQQLNINIAHLNFQSENKFTVSVESFSEVENGDTIDIFYKKGRVKLFSGVARISNQTTDRIGNKTIEVALEFPMLSKREFKKVILNDEFFLGKDVSNPDDMNNSILHIIAERLGFTKENTDFDLTKTYYNAGMSANANIPFTLFKKGDRWIDELTTILDSVGGWIYLDENYRLIYRSYTDVKFKPLIKEFTVNEIYTTLPYKFTSGTNNGAKIEFDRFELSDEKKEVFKAEKKAYVKVGERLNLKLKYTTDIVVEPNIKSCKVYYYVDEEPIYIDDYSLYVKFNLNANSGEIEVDNTFTHDIYIDDVIIEARALTKYADNSTILKDKTVLEELQEDFLKLGKNKYIQTFYMSRGKAVTEFYNKVRDTHSIDITIDFQPQYELGDKVSIEGQEYCINKISHSFDSTKGYSTKLSLIQILDPDFLNIVWKESETVNPDKPSMDLDFVNSAIEDAKEDISKDVLDKANNYTEEIKQELENQLAEGVKKLENINKEINETILDVQTELDTEKDRLNKLNNDLLEVEIELKNEIQSEQDKLNNLAQDLLNKEEGLKNQIEIESDRITSTITEVSKVESKYGDITTEHTTQIEQNKTDISLKSSKTEVDAITQRVSNAESAITTNTNAISLKASQSSVDNITGEVEKMDAELKIQAGQIATKVSSTTYEQDKINTSNRLTTAETSITQNAEVIALKASKLDVDNLTGRLQTAETSIIQNTEAIILKSSKTEVDAITQRVSNAESAITTNTNAISLKASQSSVDNITGEVEKMDAELKIQAGQIATKVSSTTYEQDKINTSNRLTTAETSITQNAEVIALKASKIEVDAIAQRMSTAETSITTNTNAISLKASQSDVNALTGRVQETEASILVEAGKITQEVTDRKTAVTELEKKVTANSTAITQTSTDITLMAQSIENHDDLLNSGSHIISQINIAPGAISINADKVNIGNGIILVEKITNMDAATNSAQATANNANTAASTAQTTANTANTTASNAQNAANVAQTTANEAKANAATAQTAATNAQNSASTANTAATNAQSSANTANTLLNDIANDNKLTASEKQSTKLEWDTIVSEKVGIEAEATRYSVDKTTYTNSYNTLNSYITPLLSNLTITSDIVGTTFRTNFNSYYTARQTLLNAVSAKAKQIADTAQTAAESANIAASNAQSTANTAQNSANSAQSSANSANENISSGFVTINANTRFNGDAEIVSQGTNETTIIRGGNITFTRNGEAITTFRNMAFGSVSTDSTGSATVSFPKLINPVIKTMLRSANFPVGTALASVFCRAELIESSTNTYKFFIGGSSTTTIVPTDITTNASQALHNQSMETTLKKSYFTVNGLAEIDITESYSGANVAGSFAQIPEFNYQIQRKEGSSWVTLINENHKMNCMIFTSGSKTSLRIRARVDNSVVSRVQEYFKAFTSVTDTGYRIVISITQPYATVSPCRYESRWTTGSCGGADGDNTFENIYSVGIVNPKTIFTLATSHFLNYQIISNASQVSTGAVGGNGIVDYIIIEQ